MKLIDEQRSFYLAHLPGLSPNTPLLDLQRFYFAKYAGDNTITVAPGENLQVAIANAAPGTTIWLSAGTYNLSSTQNVVVPIGVTIRGAGRNTTKIESNFNSSSVPIMILGDGAELHDLYLHATLLDGTYQYPLCPGEGATVSIHNVRVTGPTDAIISKYNNCTLNIYDSYIEGYWDTVAVNTDTTVINAFNTVFDAHYMAALPFPTQRGVANQSSGKINLYNCIVKATNPVNADALIYGIYGSVNAYNCQIITSGLSTNRKDVTINVSVFNCVGSNADGTLYNSTPHYMSDKLATLALENLTINKYVYANSDLKLVPDTGFTRSEDTITIAPPTLLAGTIAYTGGAYVNSGDQKQAKVYAYKTVKGVRIYSAPATSGIVADNGLNNGSYYTINWAWTKSITPGVEGYLVRISSIQGGFNFGVNFGWQILGDVALLADAGDAWVYTGEQPFITDKVPVYSFEGNVKVTGDFRLSAKTNDVHDTTPTLAQLTTAFGSPATLGDGFVGFINDADAGINNYVCWVSDGKWIFIKGTVAI